VSLLVPARAAAQGCVVVRPNAPVSSYEDPYLATGAWQFTVSQRWFRSSRENIGRTEQSQRAANGSQNINDVATTNLEVDYALSRRFSLSGVLPYQFAERSEPILDGTRVLARNYTSARGIGDVLLGARGWVFDPSARSPGNVSFGLALKLPTGQDDALGSFRDVGGTTTVRTVDTSIQPGDGGVGVLATLQAFYGWSRVTLYASATYLSNPRDQNGVLTYRQRSSEAFTSVPDGYTARAGAFFGIGKGWSAGIGGRIDGTPVEDLIGKENGFRRPGYAIAVEPGVAFGAGRWAVLGSVAIALIRDRLQSVPERRDGVHGDAAFADVVFNLSVSYRTSGDDSAVSKNPEPPLTSLGPFSVPLREEDGRPVGTAPALGARLTLVHVWATWCPPCRAEISLFNEAAKELAARGLVEE
jgi:thiol-disulfide isomerase/thioredoxin